MSGRDTEVGHFAGMDARRVVPGSNRGSNLRAMDIMVVVTGGGRWTDKMARLFIQCFELQPGVRVYRWMRHFKPIEVGCHAGGAVTVETATLFSDIQNLHAAIHADSYGLLWTVVPTLLIFPFDVKTTKGTPPLAFVSLTACRWRR